MSTFSTVICCINLTENNIDIASYSKKIAKVDNAKIVLAHVMPNTSLLAHTSLAESLSTVINESSTNVKNFLKDFIKENFEGFDVEATLLRDNSPNSILGAVEKYCADIIVMGSISSKSWYSVFLSSPTEAVAAMTRIPVMVIPNDLSLECVPSETF